MTKQQLKQYKKHRIIQRAISILVNPYVQKMKVLEIKVKNQQQILTHKITGINENKHLNKDIPQIKTLMKCW